jgi:hypothetical protein
VPIAGGNRCCEPLIAAGASLAPLCSELALASCENDAERAEPMGGLRFEAGGTPAPRGRTEPGPLDAPCGRAEVLDDAIAGLACSSGKVASAPPPPKNHMTVRSVNYSWSYQGIAVLSRHRYGCMYVDSSGRHFVSLPQVAPLTGAPSAKQSSLKPHPQNCRCARLLSVECRLPRPCSGEWGHAYSARARARGRLPV